jgi:hypothetical protein
MAGFDTADLIQNNYPSANQAFGQPKFWIRYFNPCPNASISTDPNLECDAAWDSGGKHLGAVTSPTQTRLNGSNSEGAADAYTFARDMHQTWLNVNPLQLPSNSTLYCWLDQEASTILATNYWTGWANMINTWDWNQSGVLPLFACLYTNPNSGHCSNHGCAAIATSSEACFGVWSAVPQQCGGNMSNPPTFNAADCSACHSGAAASVLWQWSDETICHSQAVDLDVGGSINYEDFCFYLDARPNP